MADNPTTDHNRPGATTALTCPRAKGRIPIRWRKSICAGSAGVKSTASRRSRYVRMAGAKPGCL